MLVPPATPDSTSPVPAYKDCQQSLANRMGYAYSSSRRPGVAWRAMPKVRAGNERHNAVNPMRQYSLFLAEYCKPLRYMRNMQRRCRGGCRMRELGCGPSPHEPFARIHQRPPLCDLRSGKVPTPLSHRDCTYTLARNSRLLICLTIYHYNFSRAISEAA